MNSNYALVTITDEKTLIATYVMIESFLRHNTWFDGDIVLMTDKKICLEKNISIL